MNEDLQIRVSTLPDSRYPINLHVGGRTVSITVEEAISLGPELTAAVALCRTDGSVVHVIVARKEGG